MGRPPAPAALAPPAASRTRVDIREESPTRLEEYGAIQTAFEVRERLVCNPVDGGLGGILLTCRPVERPWIKDYDAIDGNRPVDWPAYFDVARWGILAAYMGSRRVGGAIVAHDTPELAILGGRDDRAALWDLRVAPDARRQGVGAALFAAGARWATARGCRALVIETQDVNVAACRFYARQGCTLHAIERFAYPALPDETRLLWHVALPLPPHGRTSVASMPSSPTTSR